MATQNDVIKWANDISPTCPLDLGIAEAVKRLRDGNIHTYESCDGSPGHSYSEPTVRFYGTQAEGWRALAICKDYGLPVRRLNRSWDMDEGEPSGPYWELVFRHLSWYHGGRAREGDGRIEGQPLRINQESAPAPNG